MKKYKKMSTILARQLTQQDYEERKGVITTQEGPVSFKPGDYLAQDRKGEWPIKQEKMRLNYKLVGDGQYQSLEVREARQMEEEFRVNGLQGKAGDFLVSDGSSMWVVDQELFYETYQEVE